MLSEAEIHCPSISQNGAMDAMSNCNINVHGNGTDMLNATSIYSPNGFNDFVMECNYATSVQYNCFDDHEPSLYCYDAELQQNESCALTLSKISNEWKCLNEEVNICHYDDDGLKEQDVRNENIGLAHNKKGQIVLTVFILVTSGLCTLVCIVKKENIKEWMANPGAIPKYHDEVMRIPNYNNGIGGEGKNKYAVLEESYSQKADDDRDESFIVGDDEENEFDDSLSSSQESSD